MMLLGLIALLVLGGLLAWLLEGWHGQWPRWISLAVLTVELAVMGGVWLQHLDQGGFPVRGMWLADLQWPWIPRFGITLHLAMDGLSLLLVLLTLVLGILAVLASWTEVRERVGFFHGNLLWVLAGVVGVFLALDLFLFYVFWEVMLVPMYFLIGIWGHENRLAAAIKFFLFTQASSLLMLVAILTLVFIHYRHTGVLTFDSLQLWGTPVETSRWLVAFAVKLPAVPLHTWRADAHTEAPTAGSVILAGVLLKTGAYGLLRFAVPLFPEAAAAFAPLAMALGVIGILYGAVLACAQTDLKRLVAYTSVSHMGFVLLGVFGWNELALQGVVMQMLCHGLSTGALFILVGALQERLHTRDLGRLGGLWSVMPRMGGMALFFALATLGLPGLGNFVGELLILLGSYQRAAAPTVVATAGFVVATLYSLRLLHQAFYGPTTAGWRQPDLATRELIGLGALAVALVWLGLSPQPVLHTADAALAHLRDPPASVLPPTQAPPGERTKRETQGGSP